MNASPVENAIRLIEDAFANVVLGDGVSLREADVIDDYGSVKQRANARAGDETDDWRKIPDELIESYPDVLCFMNEAGLRFHLPAYMHFALRGFRDSESRSSESALYCLCSPESIDRLRSCLSQGETEAIVAFLTVCLDIEEFSQHAKQVELAIRHWGGDEDAAGELHRLSESRGRMISEFVGLSSELGPQWFSDYCDGKLPLDAARRVQGLFLEMHGGDPAE